MQKVKSPRSGQIRCLNCFERIAPTRGAKLYTCPHCNLQWRISWVNANMAKIRGPVWEKLRQKTT